MYSRTTRKRLRRGLALLTSLVILLFCILDFSGTLEWLENRTSDWRTLAALQPSEADPGIVIIDIDNASFQEITAQIGRWPWTRALWTELLGYLQTGKPRMVLFDVIFSGSEPQVDGAFASAIRTSGNVILPFAFVASAVKTDRTSVSPPKALVSVEGRAMGLPLPKTAWTVNVPDETLLSSSTGSGSTLGNADRDGITRRLPLTISYDGRQWATLWLAAAMKLTGAGSARFENGQFIAGKIRLPVDNRGNYIVRWHGTPQNAYKRVPLIQMVCSVHPDLCDASVIRHPPEEFRDKTVFIGASAAGSYEVRPLAVSETAPGVFILASALDNLLHNHAIYRTGWLLTILLVVFLAIVPALAVERWRSILGALLVVFSAVALFGAACFLFYSKASIWLPMTAPLLACVVSFSASTVFRYVTVDRELSRTRGTLERYVSPQLVRYVMDHLESFRFDGEKRKLTIFFSDVRGFTTLTEKSDPVVLLKQLNEYLEAMTDIIFRYDGIVDKFIGDGVMAHWGAFTPDRPNALLAARASLDMMDKLGQLNRQWTAAGLPPLDIGIGLNTAEVIFGNVGTGKKLDFTAIGDGVNLAARLESANKEYHTHIIISEATRREIGEQADVRALGTIVVKGKSVGVEIFELSALNPAPSQVDSSALDGVARKSALERL